MIEEHATTRDDSIAVATVEDELRRLRQELRLHRDFLSTVVHELRTPLAVILGYTQTLAKDIDRLSEDQVRQISKRTRDASRRMRRLVADLADFSHAERHSLHVDVRATSVPRVLDQSIFETSGKGHPIELSLEPDLPPVLTDRDRLGQIVVNLINNAEKFSREGSVIKVSARRSPAGVSISVEDEGEGIAPEMLPRIFERYFQVEEARNSVVGMGIGLFLVKEICDLMGATVEVESEVGRGSRFTIEVPLARAEIRN